MLCCKECLSRPCLLPEDVLDDDLLEAAVLEGDRLLEPARSFLLSTTTAYLDTPL